MDETSRYYPGFGRFSYVAGDSAAHCGLMIGCTVHRRSFSVHPFPSQQSPTQSSWHHQRHPRPNLRPVDKQFRTPSRPKLIF